MTKLDKLSKAAASLSDDQIDGLIAYAEYLAGEPMYYAGSPEMMASIERGLADAAAGRVTDGETYFKAAAARIAASQK